MEEDKIEFDRIENEENEEELDTFTEEDLSKPEEFPKDDTKKDTKQLLVIIGVIVVCFIIVFAGTWLFKGQSKKVVTIEDLHRMNFEGEFSDINYMYNGFSFVKQGNIWYTEVENENGVLFDVPLHYGPNEVEDISISGEITDEFLEPPLYITFDPLSTQMQYVALSVAELSSNMVKGFGLEITAACDKNETEACEARAIVPGCVEDKAVVYIKESNNTGVFMNGNCVVVEGAGTELLKSTDRFLLKLYQVMD